MRIRLPKPVMPLLVIRTYESEFWLPRLFTGTVLDFSLFHKGIYFETVGSPCPSGRLIC